MNKKCVVTFFLLLVCSIKGFAQNEFCLGSQEFKIVVLGSSTSAGSGTSNLDSSWVNKYRSYLQGFNPNNEVINLGVGGYNTYKIMRTGFTPPSGRPSPDTIRNITTAINEAPDAIIVNMPSNDVSAGYSYQEQMNNFDSIVELATDSGIPIWICTTQPLNFSDTNKLNLQWEVKDSIYAHFNPRTIDFWSTIALPDYTIDPFYDSGDGVHLNDVGHGLLFERVRDKAIIDSLYQPLPYTDYALLDFESSNSICGDSVTNCQLTLGNYGVSNSDTVFVNVVIENTTTGGVYMMDTILPSGINGCEIDTILFSINTYLQGNYEVNAFLTNVADAATGNDTLIQSFYSAGHPDLIPLNDTLCDTGIADLEVVMATGDTVFWYSDLLSSVPIGSGTYLSTLVTGDSIFYAQSIRGDLFFKNEVLGATSSSINWNGTMFDLVAEEDLFLDSIGAMIQSLGGQIVDIYVKEGSHLGSESTPSDWTFLDSVEVNVISGSVLTMLPLNSWAMMQGDSAGVYLQLRDPASNLSYNSVGSQVIHSSNQLTMITGSGISHNFSGNYYPRDFTGGVYFHYGDRPLGECATDRIEVNAFVSQVQLSTISDTIIDISESITVSATGGMAYYEWFDGSNDSIIVLDAANLGQGIHYINVFSIDTLGCEHVSEFVLGVADLVGLNELDFNLNVYPNPFTTALNIDFTEDYSVNVIDINGRQVLVEKKGVNQYDVSNLKEGVYFLKVSTDNAVLTRKIIKIQH